MRIPSALGLVSLLFCGACVRQGNEAVRASSFGWSREDSTACLQAAFDSGAKRIVVDRQKGDWIVRPLSLNAKRDVTVVFEDGVVVRAKRGEFRDVRDTLLTLNACSNVVLRGMGAVRLVMNKADYADGTKYKTGEWRHALAVFGGENVRVENLTLAESGGDGIYVHSVKNLVLEDVISRGHYRQGMSVIRVNGLLARRCRFVETSGAAPQSGVDIEPNNWYEELSGIVFENCDFNDNAMAGLNFFVPGRTAKSPPFDVTLRNCRFLRNRQCGIWVVQSAKESARGTLNLEDCRSAGNGGSPFYLANAAARGGLSARVNGCVFDARGTKFGRAAIDLLGADADHDFGAVTFADCTVLADGVPPVRFLAKPGIGLTAVRGVLKVVEQGKERTLDLADFARDYPSRPELLKPFRPARLDLVRLRAVTDGRAADENEMTYRWHCSFVQYVPKAGEYPIRFRQTRLTEGSSYAWQFKVSDADGRIIDTPEMTREVTTYVLKADKPGVYRFDGSSGHSLLNIRSEFPGHGSVADRNVELFKGRNHRFFFRMPAGAREIEVRLSPQEPGSAQLVSPSGEIVVAVPVQSIGSVIRHARKDVSKAETWEIRFPYIEEDYSFAIGGDAVPVAATGCPENVLE